VQLKNTKVKKWLRVDGAGVVLASTKRDEVEDNGDNDGNDNEEKKKELERRNKKKKSKKNSNIDTKGKDKLKEEDKEDVNKLARPEAGGDDDDNSGKATESGAATAADLKKTRTTKEVEANAPATTTRGKEAEFGWSVVRPAEEGWACMLLLVELFAELNAAHGFDEERLAKLAGQLS
jgi:hypothetical protein